MAKKKLKACLIAMSWCNMDKLFEDGGVFMAKKIIIFGATGDVGLYLTDYLAETVDRSKYDIIASGRMQTNFFDRYNVEYINLDLTIKADFEKLPNSDVHAVIMLSGLMPAHVKEYNPQDYIDVNITGGLNVLEYCRRVQADRIIYAQSISDIIGYLGTEKLLKPDLARSIKYTGDHAMYIISKNCMVDIIEHYRQEFGLKSIIVRLPNIYMHTATPYYFVNCERRMKAHNAIIEKAIKGEDIEIWGDSNQEKDMVYVKDLAQIVEKSLWIDREYGLYNIGTGIGITIENQVKGIVEVFSQEGNKSKISYAPDKPSGNEYIMDVTNAKEDLGYEPKYDYISYLRDLKQEMEIDRFKDFHDEKCRKVIK